MAESLKDYLNRHADMDDRCTKGGSVRYFTTENEEKFKENARIFLPRRHRGVASVAGIICSNYSLYATRPWSFSHPIDFLSDGLFFHLTIVIPTEYRLKIDKESADR